MSQWSKNIILAATRAGQTKSGVEKFPYYIQRYVKPCHNIVDIQNHRNDIKHDLQAIYEANMKYTNTVNIGGDHSIAIATGASTLCKYPNAKFIWIDAHADIHTYNSSDSKNIHGMPLGYLTGLDKNPPIDIIKHHLPFQNILYIGLRDIEYSEYESIKNKNIKYILSEKVNAFPTQVSQYISNFVNGSPVHLSFDVDAIDPKYISSTGTPVSDGINITSSKFILDHLINNENIVNIDIVEMNLEIGSKQDQQTTENNFFYLFPDLFHQSVESCP